MARWGSNVIGMERFLGKSAGNVVDFNVVRLWTQRSGDTKARERKLNRSPVVVRGARVGRLVKKCPSPPLAPFGCPKGVRFKHVDSRLSAPGAIPANILTKLHRVAQNVEETVVVG